MDVQLNRNGDLDNSPAPRMLLVWEGALAFIRQGSDLMFDKLVDQQRWEDAARLFYLNQLMVTIVWNRAVRQNINLEVVTYIGGDEFAGEVARIIGENHLPVRSVWYIRPEVLARKLPSMPDVVRVYDPFKTHELYFGAVGRYITDANMLGRA